MSGLNTFKNRESKRQEVHGTYVKLRKIRGQGQVFGLTTYMNLSK